ncbi:uncharacterized protein BJ171DRAFT_524418 [Polychytrium aggregatum]|uniref:uncharacterized protein n=1 Tax=Polychytrium aggregatum TaxID=110093 RepID=UPI0022FE0B67|nr:uncharacterized protein BJ171DRAFT_524418 [Polychytrium aggregatum]KAI9193746.1 hypothetical protein BJ171DRAFT_524418 [Polychytrium aggregatum]
MSNSIFALAPSILGSIDLSGPALVVSGRGSQTPVNSSPFNAPDVRYSEKAFYCATCSKGNDLVTFNNVAVMRDHFRSDWHRYNMTLKMKCRLPISEEDFDELSDVSSIDASDQSESESSDDEEQKHNRSPFISLRLTTIDSGETASVADGPNASSGPRFLRFYKQALSLSASEHGDPAKCLKQLQEYQSKQPVTWTLIMLGSGHFAGAVFDCKTGKALVHKTLHRYTTRRKQGGAQSSNDNSKGKAKSAGAQLRRYNEMALREDIRRLMEEWKEHIRQSDLVFVRVPVRSRSVVFCDPAILEPSSDKVRGFPFTTRRPTFGELQRCLQELCWFRVETTDPSADIGTSPAPDLDDQNAASNPVSIPAIDFKAPSAVDEEATRPAADPSAENDRAYIPIPSAMVLKAVDLARRGQLEKLQSHVEAHAIDVNTLIPDDVSLLHAASLNGHADAVVYLLEQGADPTTKGGQRISRVPYDVAANKDTRDAFRRFVAAHPTRWDYKLSNIPGPLTAEMEERQKEKLRDKKKKQKERQKQVNDKKERSRQNSEEELKANPTLPEPAPAARKGVLGKILTTTEREAIGISPERRAALDREKRAQAAEARLRSQQSKCATCGKSLEGITSFDKFQYRYCSVGCVKHEQ